MLPPLNSHSNSLSLNIRKHFSNVRWVLLFPVTVTVAVGVAYFFSKEFMQSKATITNNGANSSESSSQILGNDYSAATTPPTETQIIPLHGQAELPANLPNLSTEPNGQAGAHGQPNPTTLSSRNMIETSSQSEDAANWDESNFSTNSVYFSRKIADVPQLFLYKLDVENRTEKQLTNGGSNAYPYAIVSPEINTLVVQKIDKYLTQESPYSSCSVELWNLKTNEKLVSFEKEGWCYRLKSLSPNKRYAEINIYQSANRQFKNYGYITIIDLEKRKSIFKDTDPESGIRYHGWHFWRTNNSFAATEMATDSYNTFEILFSNPSNFNKINLDYPNARHFKYFNDYLFYTSFDTLHGSFVKDKLATQYKSKAIRLEETVGLYAYIPILDQDGNVSVIANIVADQNELPEGLYRITFNGYNYTVDPLILQTTYGVYFTGTYKNNVIYSTSANSNTFSMNYYMLDITTGENKLLIAAADGHPFITQ